MGVFYSTPTPSAPLAAPVVTKVLMEALAAQPETIPDAQQVAARLAATLTQVLPPPAPPPKSFQWARFLLALLLLALVFFAGIYCAQKDMLQKWSDVLLHTFEVLLGAVVGIVVGENTAK